jgi:hypothetical protein
MENKEPLITPKMEEYLREKKKKEDEVVIGYRKKKERGKIYK